MKYSSSIPVPSCRFTFRHYDEILKSAKDSGYEFISMEGFASGKRADNFLIIRHDMDFSPIRAVEFAKIENKYGAKATYFIRVHSDKYNPFGFETYKIIKEIIELGHDIGLHYEHLDFVDITGEDPSTVLLREKKLLETIFDITIKGLAPHRDFTPTINRDFWKDKDIRDFGFSFEAYMDVFLEDIYYTSDSLGKWGGDGKCLCQFIGVKKRIYALIHPLYWYQSNYHIHP
ncbi:MAG: hypothetical protein JSV09_15065 [Thermoplasmata archaeon]|nr:MAG: hypothetical protein JSV09_15065 [Thermoplasmata archaeon]